MNRQTMNLLLMAFPPLIFVLLNLIPIPESWHPTPKPVVLLVELGICLGATGAAVANIIWSRWLPEPGPIPPPTEED